MKIESIYNELKKDKIGESRFFGRELIIIRKKDFLRFNKFSESFNIFTNKKNYRTGGWFKHIHAVEVEPSKIQFHYDYGNINKNIIFGALHFIIDVVPY